MEFVSWIAHFEVASKKVMETCMGLLALSGIPQPDDFDFVNLLNQQEYNRLQQTRNREKRRKTAAE